LTLHFFSSSFQKISEKTMKLLAGLALVGVTEATFSMPYLRSMSSEKTLRAFDLNFEGEFNCEPGFTGSDCSQLKCPYAPSFATSDTAATDWLYTPSNARPNADVVEDADFETSTTVQESTFDNQHAYRECGGRGLCDRSTGECKCFGGFTGEGCRRTTCPNDCSGHGICLTDNTAYFRDGTDANDNMWGVVIPGSEKVAGADTFGVNWQRGKFSQCSCDRGYEGFDCALRRCPHGDDPETSCDDELGADIQQFVCSQSSAGVAYFALTFDDQMGGRYHTRSIKYDPNIADEENAESVQDALEALPNFAIPSVEVDFSDDDFSVTFVDATTTGQQSLLGFSTSNDCDSGQQPKLGSMNDYSCDVSRDLLSVGDYKESVECSNRGTCDRDTGICTCFSGYYGLACDQVTTYI
jgi:hypothetical protein